MMFLWGCDMDYNTSSIIVKRFFFKIPYRTNVHFTEMLLYKNPFIITNEVYKLDLKKYSK